jgi:hypothetical protein
VHIASSRQEAHGEGAKPPRIAKGNQQRKDRTMKTLKIEVDEIGNAQTLEIEDDSYEFYGVVVWEWHYDTSSGDLLRSYYFATEKEAKDFLKDVIENGYGEYKYEDYDPEIQDDGTMLRDGIDGDREVFITHNWNVTVTA